MGGQRENFKEILLQDLSCVVGIPSSISGSRTSGEEAHMHYITFIESAKKHLHQHILAAQRQMSSVSAVGASKNASTLLYSKRARVCVGREQR